jgi:hypothetical protein
VPGGFGLHYQALHAFDAEAEDHLPFEVDDVLVVLDRNPPDAEPGFWRAALFGHDDLDRQCMVPYKFLLLRHSLRGPVQAEDGTGRLKCDLPSGAVSFSDGTVEYPDGSVRLANDSIRLPSGEIRDAGEVANAMQNLGLHYTEQMDGTVKLNDPEGTIYHPTFLFGGEQAPKDAASPGQSVGGSLHSIHENFHSRGADTPKSQFVHLTRDSMVRLC